MAALGARDRRDPAVHRVHGRRALERLAARRGRAGRGDRSSAIGAGWPIEPAEPHVPRRGRRPLALPRRRRRVRGHLVGHAAVLPRLHARAPVRRGPALHLPVRGRRPRPARPCSATAPSDEELPRSSSSDLARPRRPLLGAAARPRRPTCCRRSRCSRWAAEARPAGRPQACPQPRATSRGQRSEASAGVRG